MPRGPVVDYLTSIKRDLGIRYLEHLVNDLQEMSPSFHDRLVTLYLDEASDSSIDESRRNEVRERLVKFLEESDQYMPERVLAKLSRSTIRSFIWELILDDQFLPEKAVVLSKMGQHKAALEIYVFKLKNYAKAERYSTSLHVLIKATASVYTHKLIPHQHHSIKKRRDTSSILF